MNTSLVVGPAVSANYLTEARAGAQTLESFISLNLDNKDFALSTPEKRDFFYQKLKAFVDLSAGNLEQFDTASYRPTPGCKLVPEVDATAALCCELEEEGYTYFRVRTRKYPSIFSDVYTARVYFPADAYKLQITDASTYYMLCERVEDFVKLLKVTNVPKVTTREIVKNLYKHKELLHDYFGYDALSFPRLTDPDGLGIKNGLRPRSTEVEGLPSKYNYMEHVDLWENFVSFVDGQVRDRRKIDMYYKAREIALHRIIHFDAVPYQIG